MSRMGCCWSRVEEKVTVPVDYTPLYNSLGRISEATNETDREEPLGGPGAANQPKEIKPLSI